MKKGKMKISDEIIVVKKSLSSLKGGDAGGATWPPAIEIRKCQCTPPNLATYCDNAS